jgi:hypothetical protein
MWKVTRGEGGKLKKENKGEAQERSEIMAERRG